MNITLKQLSVFVTTARLNRITQAAEELCLTQSAASQSLKELENTLGYQVFNRTGRKLLLNDAGRSILTTAITMLELQNQLQQPIMTELKGELKVAASVTIGSYVMPKLLANFVQQYPKVEPKLYISNSADVIERLSTGQAHIGLIEAPMSHSELIISPWRRDELAVFCAQEHKLANKPLVTITEMSQQRWILREQGSGTRAVFVGAMQQQGGVIEHSMDLSRQEAIKQAVKANLGLGVLSFLSIEQELSLGLFKKLHTPLNLNRQFSIVQSEHYQQNKLVSAFKEFLQQGA
ncbi:MAG: LysR family transcriptional regulator [Alteromonadaceae bacterium]|nr:LysR family transcriptional regulator [Alteromonadaceae bacterium]